MKKNIDKLERIYFIPITLMGIGFGLQLARIQKLDSMPISIYDLGFIIFFIGLIGMSILVWKRDKLQNK